MYIKIFITMMSLAGILAKCLSKSATKTAPRITKEVMEGTLGKSHKVAGKLSSELQIGKSFIIPEKELKKCLHGFDINFSSPRFSHAVSRGVMTIYRHHERIQDNDRKENQELLKYYYTKDNFGNPVYIPFDRPVLNKLLIWDPDMYDQDPI